MRLFCVIFKHLEILTRFKTKVERFILQPSRSCTYSTSVSLAFLCPLLAWQTQNGFYNTFYGLGTIFNEPLPSNKKKCENELAQIVKLFLHYVNTSVWNKVALSDDTNGNKKIDDFTMLDFIPDSIHLEVQVKFNFYENKILRIVNSGFPRSVNQTNLKCINNFKTTRNS